MFDDIEIARRYIKKFEHANKKGQEFSLTFAQFKRIMNRKTCAYSGLEFSKPHSNNAGKMGWRSVTLERIDNTKGYVMGNVIPVCSGINNLKSQWENPNHPLTEALTIKIITKLELLRKKS